MTESPADGVALPQPALPPDLDLLFRQWVGIYQSRVAEAVAILRALRGLPKPQGPLTWRNHLAPALTGHADPARRIHYRLRGGSCDVEHPGFHVSWDFGPAGECDGFDSARIWTFLIRNRLGPHVLRDEAVLRRCLLVGVEQGMILRRRSHYCWS